MQRDKTIQIIIITFSILLYLSCNSNDKVTKEELNYEGLNSAIKDTILKIAAYGNIDGEGIGVGGETSIQWYRQQWIKKNLNTEELLLLKDNSNNTVKAVIWESLAFKDFPKKFELFEELMKDTSTTVDYQFGCLGGQMLLAEYIGSAVLCIDRNNPPPTPSYFTSFHFTDTELDTLSQIYHQFHH